MKLYNVVSLILAVGLVSCTHYPDEPLKGTDRSNPTIEQIGYTAVRITDGGQVSRSEKDIRLLGFGVVGGQGFTEQFRREPVWVPKDGSWLLSFNETLTIPDDVPYTTVRMRKYRSAGGWIDEDHVIPTNRFPYAENEILVSNSILTEGFAAGGYFQDLAAVGNKLYLLTLGPTTVWESDLEAKTNQQMLVTGSGDHITSDGQDVFIDFGHSSIYRWNGVKDDLGQLIRDYPFFSTSFDIWGLAAEEGKLYSLMGDWNTGEQWLLTMDYDGALRDSIPLALSEDYYAAVQHGVLHVVHNGGYDDDPFLIYRYDIAARRMLNPLLAPSRWVDGIDISGGFFYYVDFTRNIAGRVPYDQMKEISIPAAKMTPNIFPTRRQSLSRPDIERPLQ